MGLNIGEGYSKEEIIANLKGKCCENCVYALPPRNWLCSLPSNGRQAYKPSVTDYYCNKFKKKHSK
jgi:hypothetical protein